MGQTASSHTHIVQNDDRHVTSHRRHSSRRSAFEESREGEPQHFNSQHSETSGRENSQRNNRTLSCHSNLHNDEPTRSNSRRKSARTSHSSASRNSRASQTKSEDLPPAREKRRKRKMASSKHARTLENTTRLISQRDKAAFEVQSALQMLDKYKIGADQSLTHLSIEDLGRLEDGFKRMRCLLDSIAAIIRPYDYRLASELLVNKAIYIHKGGEFADLAKARFMLQRIDRNLQKVESLSSSHRRKVHRKAPQDGVSMGTTKPDLWTPAVPTIFLGHSEEMLESAVSSMPPTELDLRPEGWYLSPVTDAAQPQHRSQLGALTSSSSTPLAAMMIPEAFFSAFDSTRPDASTAEFRTSEQVNDGLKEKVDRFRPLTSGNVPVPSHLPSNKFMAARIKKEVDEHEPEPVMREIPVSSHSPSSKFSEARIKNDVDEPVTRDLKERLAALRKSIAETTSIGKRAVSVNFSRPLTGAPIPDLPISSRIPPPSIEKRKVLPGNLPSPSLILDTAISSTKAQESEIPLSAELSLSSPISSKSEGVISTASYRPKEIISLTPPPAEVKFSLTQLPVLTDPISYMQLTNVDIVEFSVVDDEARSVLTWYASTSPHTIDTSKTGCITIVRAHAAEKLKAEHRSLRLWFPEPRSIATFSMQRVNIFLDPYIRLALGTEQHVLDYASRMTLDRTPMNKVCVTVGELRKRAQTQLNIKSSHRLKLAYQGITLNDEEIVLKEACMLSSRVREGWDPLYVQVIVEAPKECLACSDELPATRFPRQSITLACNHECNTCRKCLRKWIKSQIKSAGWNKIKCTECPAILQHADIKAHASPRQFEKYDTFATRAVVNADPDFHWCINPSCGSGHSHSSGIDGPIFNCRSCGTVQCIHHSIEWHTGETCEQYDHRKSSAKRRKEEEKASAKTIQETTKACPECKANIEKNDGCDHMTCRKCRHEFCWVCLAEYDHIRRLGNSYHNVRCLHYRGMPEAPRIR